MEDFSLRELECFVAVAEELSFTRAAERLRLAQPPLSRHIRNLEEKLGVVLFERSRRGVRVTEAGRAFREETAEILVRLRRAGEQARRAAMGETGRLEVGFVSAVLSPELVRVFSQYRQENPTVQLNLHDRLPVDQLTAIGTGELDLGFIGVLPERLPEGVESVPWIDEPLMVFLPPDHPLAGAKSVQVSQLASDPFVMIASEAAPAFVAGVREICQDARFRPRVVQEARRAQAVAAMTVVGAGVAILPETLDRITGNGVPLREGRVRLRITQHVAYRGDANESASGLLGIL
ncbi:MAG: LysR substrate-binding domain-containing protein [Verrucomicrobiota bacterium]